MSGYICQNCRNDIRYITEYSQWWCDFCQTYVTGAYSAPSPVASPEFGPPAPSSSVSAEQEMQAHLATAAYNEAVLSAAAAPEIQRQMLANDFDWDDVDPDGVDDGLDDGEDDDRPQRPRRQLHGQQRRLMQRRARELRVRGFDRDEIVLILRDGYDEEKVISMRGNSRRPAASLSSTGSGPGPAQAQPTTIIVQGDFIGSKNESNVSVKDSVLNRANVGGGGGGAVGASEPSGAASSHAKYKRAVQRALRNDGKVDANERGFLEDIREVEGLDEATAVRLEREVAQEQASGFRNLGGACPQCKAQSQPGWKVCPECGARLLP